jgi:hypothetical protein
MPLLGPVPGNRLLSESSISTSIAGIILGRRRRLRATTAVRL